MPEATDTVHPNGGLDLELQGRSYWVYGCRHSSRWDLGSISLDQSKHRLVAPGISYQGLHDFLLLNHPPDILSICDFLLFSHSPLYRPTGLYLTGEEFSSSPLCGELYRTEVFFSAVGTTPLQQNFVPDSLSRKNPGVVDKVRQACITFHEAPLALAKISA